MPIIEQTRYVAIEPGIYPARVESVSVEDGQFGPQVKLTFGLLDEELVGKTLTAWASAKLSPKSKLYGWTRALIFGGKDLPEGFDLDTDTLIGREALLNVEVEEKEGQQFNRVSALLPVRRTLAKTASMTAATNGGARVTVNRQPEPEAEPPAWDDEGDDGVPF